jgi:hypothetical protein
MEAYSMVEQFEFIISKIYIQMNRLKQGVLYIDTILEKITRPIYYSLLVILYCLYFFIIVGVFYINTTYVRMLIMAIQVFIACILIIRFHPLRHHSFNESDSDIIFASACFLLLNAFLTEKVIEYLKNLTGIHTPSFT